jgi:hypothetical protein
VGSNPTLPPNRSETRTSGPARSTPLPGGWERHQQSRTNVSLSSARWVDLLACASRPRAAASRGRATRPTSPEVPLRSQTLPRRRQGTLVAALAAGSAIARRRSQPLPRTDSSHPLRASKRWPTDRRPCAAPRVVVKLALRALRTEDGYFRRVVIRQVRLPASSFLRHPPPVP